MLKAEHVIYHRYQLKQDRAFIVVVLRNIHRSVPIEDMAKALREKWRIGQEIYN